MKTACRHCFQEKPGEMRRFSLDGQIVVFCESCWTDAIKSYPLALRPQDYRAVINYLLALPDKQQATVEYLKSIGEAKQNAKLMKKL